MGRRRARASTATRTSSSGRCSAGPGTCTTARPWRPATTRVDDHPADGAARLLRGRDADKDQTYFLYGLRQDQLAHARFPLGELTKPEVRAVARGLGLATADKPESQEICFVPGGDYRDALRRAGRLAARARAALRRDGTVGGDARGPAGYTVGQRQGLGVALGEPRYVSRIDPLTNTIQLGRREDLETRTSLDGHVHRRAATADGRDGASGGAPDPPSRTPIVAGLVRPAARMSRARRPLDRRDRRSPVWAAAPGQAAVLYDGETSSWAAAGSRGLNRHA